MEIGNGNKNYLNQFTTTFGTVYYWEMYISPSTPRNLVEHYTKHIVHINATFPENRPLYHEIKLELSQATLDYFKSKQGFVPRDYQIDGINCLLQCFCDMHGCILADEMRLGKTIQFICFLRQLHRFGFQGPHIVVVRNNTFNQWCREPEEWCDFMFLDFVLPIFKRENRQVLVFSQRIKVLSLLAEFCTLRKYTYAVLDGQLTTDEMKTAIDAFLSDNSDVFIFLISTKSGAEGLNLTKASVTIIYDPDCNPNNDLQALGRCHRIGQTKQVLVLRLITYGTYEHTMYIRAQRKLRLWTAVLGDGGGNLSIRAKAKPHHANTVIARPYIPVLFATVARRDAEETVRTEIPAPPPDIAAMRPDAARSLDDVLGEFATIVKDISKYGDPGELSFDAGENSEGFLRRIVTEEINISKKRRQKTRTPTYQIEPPTARAILSALERHGCGQCEAITRDAGRADCPIDIVTRFCLERPH